MKKAISVFLITVALLIAFASTASAKKPPCFERCYVCYDSGVCWWELCQIKPVRGACK
jgi:hypothetical protein